MEHEKQNISQNISRETIETRGNTLLLLRFNLN